MSTLTDNASGSFHSLVPPTNRIDTPMTQPITLLSSRPRKNLNDSSILGSLAAIIELMAQMGSLWYALIISQSTVGAMEMLSAKRTPRRWISGSLHSRGRPSLMQPQRAVPERIDRPGLGRAQ